MPRLSFTYPASLGVRLQLETEKDCRAIGFHIILYPVLTCFLEEDNKKDSKIKNVRTLLRDPLAGSCLADWKQPQAVDAHTGIRSNK